MTANPDAAETTGESRRQRHRRELIDQLCDEARSLLASGGAGSVTWRGLARAVGMSPASLYTYFDGLDALFTELILRSYGALALFTESAATAFASAPPGDRILVGPFAYRRWALDHRGEFNLIFTDQLPGYAAEPGGATVDAQMAIFRPMTEVVTGALAPDGVVPDVGGSADADLRLMIGIWGIFHGLVSLEVNHHFDWLDAPQVFEDRVRWAIDAAGLPAARAEFRVEFERWARTTRP